MSHNKYRNIHIIPLESKNKYSFHFILHSINRNHVYGTGFFADPNVYNDRDQRIDSSFVINPPQSTTNYQPGSVHLSLSVINFVAHFFHVQPNFFIFFSHICQLLSLNHIFWCLCLIMCMSIFRIIVVNDNQKTGLPSFRRKLSTYQINA